ncbi:MAG: hypothetical protein ACI89Z_000244 [Porticoccus sp.]
MYEPIGQIIKGKQFTELQGASTLYEDIARSSQCKFIQEGPLLGRGDVDEQVVQLRD